MLCIQRLDKPGASFTKLTCVYDASFGIFLLLNTHNFVKKYNSQNYNGRYKTIILAKNFLNCVIFVEIFCKNLGFSLSELTYVSDLDFGKFIFSNAYNYVK
jgi:hypothetical protein